MSITMGIQYADLGEFDRHKKDSAGNYIDPDAIHRPKRDVSLRAEDLCGGVYSVGDVLSEQIRGYFPRYHNSEENVAETTANLCAVYLNGLLTGRGRVKPDYLPVFDVYVEVKVPRDIHMARVRRKLSQDIAGYVEGIVCQREAIDGKDQLTAFDKNFRDRMIKSGAIVLGEVLIEALPENINIIGRKLKLAVEESILC